ncbi:putative signal peptide peptidase, S49 family [Cupriavidus taiwanensis]|uniref:Signal peptide peptidase, S49 family n=1 Tax=Cupriavidus taiwanensis TaxID=164546 RepID=A0A7Z7JAU8_9BURK|nr:Putative signal peptide peptidase, S49 family [Cupriavidus taiwanensis]SOZ07909.1 Putative signal peptide peptidase, S49 family [Cupriavidus taiwanensis]SPC15945.1 Putative signal peptide peptidase, S49 family [Cupriavidus taiwanensis]SPD40621.1 putative signal peptide peptidase, S49 family [Cupriavidus taiwanensis]
MPESERLVTAKRADFPLEDELRAGDDAARREARERKARLSGATAGGQVGGQASGGWERDVLEKVLTASLREQRAARRWRIFFRLVTLGLLVLILFAVFDFKGDGTITASGRHTAMVTLEGEIAAGTPASAEAINASLQAAFADNNAAGVILKINSPGGSPVQAGIINDEIHRLRGLYPSKPLYVVVEEICASGGYYVAAAADKIYVDKASIVGSIGVLMDGFGFTGLMDKLGVERRLYTSGANKGMLDPFSPQVPKQKAFAEAMLKQIHQQFIDVVKEGRGDRLKDDPELFSGLFWSGERSVALGLADGLGSAEYVARDLFKAEDIVDYTVKENIAERVAKRFGAAVGTAAMKTMLWSTGMQGMR